jgi:hypothetical protein
MAERFPFAAEARSIEDRRQREKFIKRVSHTPR